MARTNTRRDHALRDAFFLEGKQLDADPQTRQLANCHICKERIDYEATPNTTPDSHNLDHYFPVSTHPDLQQDPTNFRHAHMLCNQSRGAKTPGGGGLGEHINDWW
ncbi:hypothetical protein [Marisediminicola sp. LYQ134]|uniref:hypothetical protein n=1 Tax=Marisediminicola sp. LYQ134 TaxID=3391061 RepID=UPI0039839D71